MNPLKSDVCAALSEDANYYRATIESINANDTVLVRYIDYGNCETVSKANIKELDEKFKTISALATKMFIPIQALATDEAKIVEEIVALTKDYELAINILNYYQSHWIVDLKSHGFSLTTALVEKGLATEINPQAIHQFIEGNAWKKTPVESHKEIQQQSTQKIQQNGQPSSDPSKNYDSSIDDRSVNCAQNSVASPKPKGIAAYISHTDHPNRFFLQLNSNSDAIEELQKNISIVAPSLQPLSDFHEGAKCIAQYTIDDQWYRAKIIDTDGDITSIQFIDFGNTDTITNNELLKASTESFDVIKPYALPCALPIEPRNSSEWSDKACSKLQELAQNQLLHFEFISQSPSINYVNLFAGDRDISKELVAEGLANALEVVKSDEVCYVSHTDSLDSFYIQVDSDSNALRLIEEYLRDVNKFEILTEYTVGKICVAKFEDGEYYRAQILNSERTDAGVLVCFVDYGNEAYTNEIRALPTNIAELPHLRKHCALLLPAHVEQWSPEAEAKFHTIAQSGQTTFTTKLIKPGKKALIELWEGDRNIGEELGKLCKEKKTIEVIVDDHEISPASESVEKPLAPADITTNRQSVYVSHVNTLKDFYVQLDSKRSEINVMDANLAAATGFEVIKLDELKVNDLCAALFLDDNHYYRAKVLEKTATGAKVFFIDYGNISESVDFRKLSLPLKNFEPYAVHCQLLLPNDYMCEATDIERFQEIVFDEEAFQELEVVDDKTMPITVKFLANKKDICELIKSTGAGTINGSKENLLAKTLDNIITEATTSGAAINEVYSNLVNEVVKEHAGAATENNKS